MAENENDSPVQVSVETESGEVTNEPSLLDSWAALTTPERKEKFAALPRMDAEELFLQLRPRDQAELIAEATNLEKRSWVRMLAPDDVADLIQELGSEYREEILALLDPQTRREVIALLAYAEDNAGGLMSSRFCRLRPDMSADEAISYMRIQAKTNLELIYYAYVTEADQTLVGVVSFREIFSAPPHKKIRDLMQTELVRVPISLDQEQIAKLFSQHDFLALPVVDEWGHMKGIVTFDDIANVVQEEATEDIQKLGAMEALDAPYWHVSFFELLRKRAGWLTLLFFGEMFTAVAMGYYESEIQRAVVLALFIPLIISSGGNSGSQASTLIIRAMALGEVRMKDWLRVLWRELRMGLCLGLILGSFALLRIGLMPGSEQTYGEHYWLIGLTVAASIIGVVMWGTLSGSMLPIFLRKMKLDPATASAPFVATLVDVTGLLIYFSAAAFLLKGKLL